MKKSFKYFFLHSLRCFLPQECLLSDTSGILIYIIHAFQIVAGITDSIKMIT